jgi:hypothetical protein
MQREIGIPKTGYPSSLEPLKEHKLAVKVKKSELIKWVIGGY